MPLGIGRIGEQAAAEIDGDDEDERADDRQRGAERREPRRKTSERPPATAPASGKVNSQPLSDQWEIAF